MKRRLLLEKSSEEEEEALTMRLRFREKVRVEGREGLNNVVESVKVNCRVAIGSRFVCLFFSLCLILTASRVISSRFTVHFIFSEWIICFQVPTFSVFLFIFIFYIFLASTTSTTPLMPLTTFFFIN